MTGSQSSRNHSGPYHTPGQEACDVNSQGIGEKSGPTHRDNPTREFPPGRTTTTAKPPRLRSACDGCHAAKIRCTGGDPCSRCVRENIRCHYSYMSKLGKPKGSLNKKTIERLQQFMATETIEQSRGQLQQPQQQQAHRRPQQQCRRHHGRRSPTLSSSEPRTPHVAGADVGTTSLIGNEPVSRNVAKGSITTVAPIETQITVHSVLGNPSIPSPVSATTPSRHDASLPEPPAPHGEVASIHHPPDHNLVDATSNETETAGDLLSDMLLPSTHAFSMEHEALVAEDWSPSITDYLDMMNNHDATITEPQSTTTHHQHVHANGELGSHEGNCFWTHLIHDKHQSMDESVGQGASCSEHLARDGGQAGQDAVVASELEQCSTHPDPDPQATRSDLIRESAGSVGRLESVHGQTDCDQPVQSPAKSWGPNRPFPLVATRPSESEVSLSSASLGCDCFSSMSNCLCQLQDAVVGGRGRGTTGLRQAAQPIDVLLMRIQRSIPIVRALLSCEGCMHDSHCLLLTNMVLARLFGWLQASVAERSRGTRGQEHEKMQENNSRHQHHRPDCQFRLLPAHVQLGTYTATRELGYKVTRVLLQMHCAEVKRAASELYRRVQQVDYDHPDRSYLLSKARHLQTELKWLTEEVLGTEDGMP